MKKLTFTQKLLRQRRFLSTLIPLFALFVGLGASQTAQAQSTFGTRSVVVDAGSGSTTYNAVTNTPTGTSAPAGEFDERNFGSFDVNTGQLTLKGGTFTVIENGGDSFSQGFVDYRVFPGTISPATGTIPVNPTGSIQLTDNGVVGNVHTFSLSSASVTILGLANAGNYRFDIDFRAAGNNVDGDPISITAGNRRSQFTATGTRPAPTSFTGTQVVLDIDGVDPKTTNTTYDASAVTAAPQFDGAPLGSFDINVGELLLNGGNASTTESGGDVVAAVRLFYRVYKSGALIPGSFKNVALQGGGTATGSVRNFTLSTAQVNLITGLANSGTGSYFVETYFEADVSRANGTFGLLTDNNSGNFYRASFTTTGVPIKTTTWTGNYNDDWFDTRNWDLGVPNAITNASIPDFGPGSTIYPNIYSGSSYLSVLRAGGTANVNNSASGPAICRNLFLNGGSQALRSICRLITGTLQVYGDFTNMQDSFIQREDATIEFAGVTQAITGGSSFKKVKISGGGIKRLIGSMFIEQSLEFVDGILTTDISDPTRSFVQLADRKASNLNNGAQLIGETDNAYIRGFVNTTRADVLANESDARTFGNIGLTLLFTGTNNPGDVQVTRNTTESYVPLANRYSVRRVYGVRPSNPNTNTGGLTATITFHYLNSETMNLGASGTQNINEVDLALFVSTNSGNSFGFLGRDGAVDQTNNIVTKSGVRTFATFTLGDINQPLPVRLTSFDAKRIGTDALISWQTASEVNSKGYDVQVSTNGTEFRTLASVPSAAPNSVKVTSYSYVDKEANKSGQRYYRLRQIDTDGKETFFSPVAVSFEGKVSAATTLVAYPNPFNSFDELHLALQSNTAGKGQVLITDMTGRKVSQQTVDMTTGLTDFSVSGMRDLKAGLYLVRFTLPTGEVKNLKVQKQ